MTTRRRTAVALTAALVAALLLVLVPPAPATSSATVAGKASTVSKAKKAKKTKKTSTIKTQHVRVSWRGDAKRRVYTKTAQVPGIGDLDLICRPDETRIRLYTADRRYETQMWMQKYEQKPYGSAVAVKTARIYRWANADDDGAGGTGYYANEGLNQRPGIENRSQYGYLYGVISQRSGRNRAARSSQLDSPRPVTTFYLTWNWNGFDHPLAYRSCQIDAHLTTYLTDQRMGITWHGDDDPAPTTQTTKVPGLGDFTLECPHDRADLASLTITPATSTSSVYVERVQGEGLVEDHVDETTQEYDPATGTIGPPVPLPGNGSLRFRVSLGGTSRWFVLSSLVKRNDPTGGLNSCEISLGAYLG